MEAANAPDSRASRRRSWWGRRFVGLLVVSTMIASGCAADRVDSELLVEAIGKTVLSEHPGVLKKVVCPDPIERGAGVVVTCSGTIDGVPVQIEATQTNDDGDIVAKLVDPLFDVDAVVQKLGAQFEVELGVPTTVDCGEPAVRVFHIGLQLQCEAKDSSRSRALVLTVVDETGAYEIELG